MGSRRLPGKILMKLGENETVLDVLLHRLKMSKFTNEIIIATTPEKEDIPVIDVAKSNNVKYFIGSLDNVLERHYKAAQHYNLDIIVRVTSDCPFVDPNMLDNMITFYKDNNFDFIYNVVEELTNIPPGFDIEILSYKVLEKVFKLAKTKKDKEHVTSFINYHPDLFSIHYYNDENLQKIEGLRLTIDEPADLKICRHIYKKLNEKHKPINFSVDDVQKIIGEYPELMDINEHIKNKPLLF